jgi:hypothetical protein
MIWEVTSSSSCTAYQYGKDRDWDPTDVHMAEMYIHSVGRNGFLQLDFVTGEEKFVHEVFADPNLRVFIRCRAIDSATETSAMETVPSVALLRQLVTEFTSHIRLRHIRSPKRDITSDANEHYVCTIPH